VIRGENSESRVLYRIDLWRALGVLLLLGAGVFVAIRLLGMGLAPKPPSELGAPPLDGRRRFALRCMLLMTGLGFLSGVAGGLTEDAWGDGALVVVLHGIFRVCWAPAAVLQQIQQALLAHDATSRFLIELLGLLGLALIPIVWAMVFLGLAHVLGRRHHER
jgi:hypothetical protein